MRRSSMPMSSTTTFPSDGDVPEKPREPQYSSRMAKMIMQQTSMREISFDDTIAFWRTSSLSLADVTTSSGSMDRSSAHETRRSDMPSSSTTSTSGFSKTDLDRSSAHETRRSGLPSSPSSTTSTSRFSITDLDRSSAHETRRSGMPSSSTPSTSRFIKTGLGVAPQIRRFNSGCGVPEGARELLADDSPSVGSMDLSRSSAHETRRRGMSPSSSAPRMRRSSIKFNSSGGVPEEPRERMYSSNMTSGMQAIDMRVMSFRDAVAFWKSLKLRRPYLKELKAVTTKKGMWCATSCGDDGTEITVDTDGTGSVPEEHHDDDSSDGDDVSERQQVEYQPVAPAPISEEMERNEGKEGRWGDFFEAVLDNIRDNRGQAEEENGMEHFKNAVMPAKISSDDDDRGIEFAPPADTIPSEKTVEVKPTVVQSVCTEKKKVAVDPEKRMKYNECYNWYSRMGQPNRDDMKRRVAEMPACCKLTIEGVDELPWMTGGKALNVIAMNKVILGRN